MKKLILSIVALAMIIPFGVLFAQDSDEDSHTITIKIPEVALVDIEYTGSSKNISVEADAPTEAGEPITFDDTNDNLWLNYSSIVTGAASNRRTITASLDNTLGGIDIKIAVSSYQGAATGRGITGSGVSGPTTLTESGQNVVTGIGSSYTEDGNARGHQLTYSFEIDDDNYGELFADDHVITVNFTITDAN